MNEIDAGLTFLRVSDLGRSHRFYCDGLGLPLVLDRGSCRIYGIRHGSFLGVCKSAEAPSSNVIVTFVTDDVGGWYERMVGAGAEVDGPPRDNFDYRIHHFFATDPDGHLLEVQRFWDTDWRDPVR